MVDYLFCKSAKDLKSFTEIGLPKSYDKLFPPKGYSMENYIRDLRRSCYLSDFAPTRATNCCIRSEAKIIDALCKYRYIKTEFRPIYLRLSKALHSGSLKYFYDFSYAAAFTAFIDEHYEEFGPDAYLREDMLEYGVRQLFPGQQYDLMVKLQWPDDFESAKQNLERESERPPLFALAILKKAFENMKELEEESFDEIFAKAIVF